MAEENKTNAERFLDAYATIEHELGTLARETKYVPFSQLLYKCAQRNWVVSKNQQELREYHELRNAIVHLRDSKNEVIAEPTDRVTEDIERIAALLSVDDNILSVASSPVKTVRPTDSIRGAYAVMKHLESSKIPVYDNGRYRGIVTMENVCGWAFDGMDESLHVYDIMKEAKNERVIFLSKDDTVIDATKSFEQAMNHGYALLSVIITEHGSHNEKPLGIITIKDLPKIVNALV